MKFFVQLVQGNSFPMMLREESFELLRRDDKDLRRRIRASRVGIPNEGKKMACSSAEIRDLPFRSSSECLDVNGKGIPRLEDYGYINVVGLRERQGRIYAESMKNG